MPGSAVDKLNYKLAISGHKELSEAGKLPGPAFVNVLLHFCRIIIIKLQLTSFLESWVVRDPH